MVQQQPPRKLGPQHSGSVSQASRLLAAAALPFSDDTYVVMGDVGTYTVMIATVHSSADPPRSLSLSRPNVDQTSLSLARSPSRGSPHVLAGLVKTDFPSPIYWCRRDGLRVGRTDLRARALTESAGFLKMGDQHSHYDGSSPAPSPNFIADMLPISREYFHSYDNSTAQFHALGTPTWLPTAQKQLLMCHLTAKATVWRDVIGWSPSEVCVVVWLL